MLRGRNLGFLEAVIVVIETGRARCRRVRHVDAVQSIGVLVPGAAERREHRLKASLAAADVLAVEHYLRRKVLENRPHVTRRGDRLKRIRIDAGRDVRVGHIHRRRLADDRQRLADVASLQGDIHCQRSGRRNHQALTRNFLEARQFEHRCVLTER